MTVAPCFRSLPSTLSAVELIPVEVGAMVRTLPRLVPATCGRELAAINYYRAFQYWRLAAIVEGVLSRYLKGVMANEANTDAFRSQIDDMADSALKLIRAI